MKVILAKSAGFCYGVKRAVELAEETARRGEPCVMLGSIIHNRDVVDRLAAQGLRAVDRPDQVPAGRRGRNPAPGASPAPDPAPPGRGGKDPGRHLPQRQPHPPDRLPGGGAGPAAGDCGHARPPGGAGHCRLVPPPGGGLRGGGAGKMAV